MKNSLLGTLAVAILGTTAQTTFASPIQFQATGTLTTTVGPFTAGDSFSLTVNFDSTTPDLVGASTTGLYLGDSLSFTSAGYSATATTPVLLVNDSAVTDSLRFGATVAGGLTGPAVEGQIFSEMLSAIFAQFFGGNSLTSDALPATLTPSDFSLARLYLLFCFSPGGDLLLAVCATGFTQVDGQITAASIQPAQPASEPVPEPSTIALVSLGVLGAAVVRHRRRR